MTTIPVPKKTTADLAADARSNLAALSRDADECRSLGLMLGLFETDSQGSLVAADPWNAALTDPGRLTPEG
ncbi:hypothetical protein [Streptomyces sp. MMS24-I29]|uniref:hypothetical protein n=1 Tax=Streptomyces sp. MMS24-I29 TaxID=3351480 RepID=UPI003C7D0F30